MAVINGKTAVQPLEAETVEQARERLARERFHTVLPGHGRIHRDTPAAMRAHLQGCVDWMKTV